jgi:tetratricopeptide (TPR) repeat protein
MKETLSTRVRMIHHILISLNQGENNMISRLRRLFPLLVLALVVFLTVTALQKEARSNTASTPTDKSLIAEGIKCSEHGDYDGALLNFNRAIKINPRSAHAYYSRGLTYYKKKDYDRAIKDYSKAISLEPYFADAYDNRGCAYEEKKDYDHAIEDYSKAISLKPDLALAYHKRSQAYYFKKDYTSAWADVKKCRDLRGEVNPSFLEDLRRASGRNE